MTGDPRCPAWCDLDACTAHHDSISGRHISRVLTVAPDRGGDPRFNLRLFATAFGPMEDERPLVELDLRLDDGPIHLGEVVDIDLPQLRQLCAALGALLQVQGADRPHLTELPVPDAPKGGATS